nr:PEP/pyruvate-binding domain-containing protein [Hyphomicrobium sp. NDB2Meth4]
MFRLLSAGTTAELPAREIVGSKALNLMIMARAGLPVPPGFVLTTDLCRAYMKFGAASLNNLETVLASELKELERQTGRRFGDTKRPLPVSVRSGAAVSMPGMMETVLNVGLTEGTLRGLVRLTGNPRLALDCYRRLIEQYAEVVDGADPRIFEEIIEKEIAESGLADRHEFDTEQLKSIIAEHQSVCDQKLGRMLPEKPIDQLVATIEAVLKSWMSSRAKSYRALNGIPDDAGTAILIQAMVFGNGGPTSGSGVGFTRNPADGADALYVDYLANAQGEDVVAGRRNALGADELKRRAPRAYRDLVANKEILEKTFGDMQDFEFTIEDGQLYMLQARSGKRTPLAALQIAHDLVAAGLVTADTALKRLSSIDVDGVEYQELIVPQGVEPIAHATAASAGVAVGLAAIDPARVSELKKSGKGVILLREHAETQDIAAVAEADALVTARGARTSHAAVVARQLGKACLVACDALSIEPSGRAARFGGVEIAEGDTLSVDAATGLIYAGALEVKRTKPKEMLAEIKKWRRKSHGAGAEPAI